MIEKYKDQIQSVGLKHVLSYDNPACNQIYENRQKYKDNGFEVHIINEKADLQKFCAILRSELLNKGKDYLRIVVDYSSMERQWYANLLLFIKDLDVDGINGISCLFHYAVANYSSSSDKDLAIENIHPIEGYSTIYLPDRPTALIAGLGGEPKILVGLKSYLNVDLVHYYYCNSHFEPPMDAVYKDEFVNIEPECLHEYDFNKMIAIFNSLFDLYMQLNEKNRLLFVSCGPKPFTLVSLIFSSIYHIDVWRLKTNIGDHLVERKPSGESVVIECMYVNTK
ncbi:MAG: hypothetical protein ACI3Y0_01925 [Prevotella sp.]